MTALPRRAFLALAAAALAGTAGACTGTPPRALVLAAGEPGGFYAEFGALLAAAAASPPWRVRTTDGSAENVALVAAGTADLGLALTDVVLAARAGTDPFAAPVPLLALGRVYENYLQLAVRAESPVTDLAGLAGRPVSLGAPGSGAAVAGARLLAVTGVAVRAATLGLADATAALDRGDIDAFLWSGGLPTPAVAELAARRPIRLLPLAAQVGALRERHGPGAYAAAAVPTGVYGAAAEVPTIGVANLLVTTAALPDDAAAAVVRTLVDRAPQLVPASALGTQYLDQLSLVDTGDVPLHPGAEAAYRDLHG